MKIYNPVFTNTVDQLECELTRSKAELALLKTETNDCSEYINKVTSKLNEIENYKTAINYITKVLKPL